MKRKNPKLLINLLSKTEVKKKVRKSLTTRAFETRVVEDKTIYKRKDKFKPNE